MVIKRSLNWPLWEASAEESATHKACPVMQGSNHTGSIDINDPEQSDHGRRTIHPLQLVYINATFPCHQLTSFKLFSMPMDLVVPLSTDHTPASAAETCITCDMPRCKAVCYAPGHLAHIFLSFLSVMYLYDHMISTHMTAYLYNRATLSGTPLFPPFVCSLLFSPYGSL